MFTYLSSAVSPELAPLSMTEFCDFMRHWPTGVAVVSAAGVEGPVGCTVNSMTSLSMDPPLLVVSLAVKSRTLAEIRRTGRFGASVLGREQSELSARFASGPPAARFQGIPVVWRHGVPLIGDIPAQLVCAVEAAMRYADHVLVVGAPVWQSVADHKTPLILYAGCHQRITA